MIYLKPSSDQRRKLALLEHDSWTILCCEKSRLSDVFYIANGAGTPVQKPGQFQGTLENVNVQNVPGVGHMSIEKNQIMQQKVISEIDAAVFGRPGKKPKPAGADAVRRDAASAAAVRN